MLIAHVFRSIYIQMDLLGTLSSHHCLDTVAFAPSLKSFAHHHPLHSLPLGTQSQGIKASFAINFSLFSSFFFFFFFFFFFSSSFSFSLFSPFHFAILLVAHFPPHFHTFIHTHKKTLPHSTHPPTHTRLELFAGQEPFKPITKQASHLLSSPSYLSSEMSEAVLSQILTSLADLKATQQLLADKVRNNGFLVIMQRNVMSCCLFRSRNAAISLVRHQICRKQKRRN